MDKSSDIGITGKRQEDDNMFLRILKRFKGSHPTNNENIDVQHTMTPTPDENTSESGFQRTQKTSLVEEDEHVARKIEKKNIESDVTVGGKIDTNEITSTLVLVGSNCPSCKLDNNSCSIDAVADDVNEETTPYSEQSLVKLDSHGSNEEPINAESDILQSNGETLRQASLNSSPQRHHEDSFSDDDDDDDDDESVSSCSTSSSCSSSESYYSAEGMIIVQPHRIGGTDSPTHSLDDTSLLPHNETDPGEGPRFNLDLLARTHFPDFDGESVPDGELTESSDDESTLRKKEEKYSTKEDQDVAVFMDLAKRLPMKSLLHLLQGHVRVQNPPSEYLRFYNNAVEANAGSKGRLSTCIQSLNKNNKPLPRQKHFRWAEVTDEKVRAVVHEVRSIKEHKSLWWTPEEMRSIRAELIDVVQYFRKRRPEYIRSIEIIAKRQEQESIIEEHMKQLADNSFPRGLETHIVRMLSDHRRSTIAAVLEEQKECRVCNDNAETTMHCIREQSLAYSQLSTKFAASMAKCDEIDSLKASMSRWRGSPPAETSSFFP